MRICEERILEDTEGESLLTPSYRTEPSNQEPFEWTRDGIAKQFPTETGNHKSAPSGRVI